MSRARNLAGFVTAISPVVDLQVGVITASRFDGPFDVAIGYAQTAGIATYAQTAGIATVGGVGIHSAGNLIGIATNLNFIGAGNTFAVNGDTIDISISGSGGPGAGGAVGVSSVQKPSNLKTVIGYAVTDFEFVGAAVTGTTDSLSGVTTATVTITKTLVIGQRIGTTASLNISSGDASSIELADGSEVSLPLTLG